MPHEKELRLLPLFVVVLPLILMFAGLSVDVGMLELKKLQMQTAADAAALGAELEWERTTGNQTTLGMEDAAVNGFTNGVNNVTVTVGRPPSNGDYAGREDVQVATITQTVKSIFMGAFNGGKVTISATGVALMPPCGYVMNNAGISNPYNINITNSISLPNQGMFSRCPVYVNKGIYQASSIAYDQYAVNATGTAGQTSLTGPFDPTPAYSSLTVPDPLAGVTQPTASACSFTNYNKATSVTLNPGTYCGSVSGSTTTPGMTLSGGGTVTLNPGLYVITGGLHATSVNFNGTGVTLFFTNVSGNTTKYGYGQVIFDGVTQLNLYAPSATSGGALSTILFFTDRNWVHTAAQDFQLNDAEFYGNGIWYINGTGVQLTAKASTPYTSVYIAIIADSIYVDSSTLNLFSDFSAVSTGVSNGGTSNPANPFRTRAVLVQ